MKSQNKKRIAQIGWMPFWWGNKFNKRLASKRVRVMDKALVKNGERND